MMVSEDHPRIRGTNNVGERPMPISTGSSPHTRDKSKAHALGLPDSRIIPAYAGQIIMLTL